MSRFLDLTDHRVYARPDPKEEPLVVDVTRETSRRQGDFPVLTRGGHPGDGLCASCGAQIVVSGYVHVMSPSGSVVHVGCPW